MARTSERSKPGTQKWERLEALLNRYVTPAMTEAGFVRTDGQYRISSAGGDLVVVDVRGNTPTPELSFFIEWAAIPKALREFHSGGNGKIRPRWEWGIVHTRFRAPHGMNKNPDFEFTKINGEDLWALAPEPGVEAIGEWDPAFLAQRRAKLLGFDAFGERLEQVLRTEAVPLWLSALDRQFLARMEWADFYLGGRSGIREAILFVDEGDPTEISAWLDQAEQAAIPPPEPPLVDPALIKWLRQRVKMRTV